VITPVDSLDRALFEGEEMRAALAARDIGTVYRHLRRLGVSQRNIAQLTGQSQSEVSEIIRGRQVSNVWLLERIADGLGIPRAWLGVSYGEEEVPEAAPAEEEVDEAVKRRVLIATATTTVVGQALWARGDPVALALPTSTPLPSRLGISDVHALRAVTEQLRGVRRYYGGQAEVFGATAAEYTRWLEVPATEPVKTALAAALAELYTEAGWSCYDSGLDGTGFFTWAMSLGNEYGDTYGVANAALHAGWTRVRSGHPNDALKLFQLGQLGLSRFRLGRPTPVARADDPRLPTLAARLSRESATAFAVMKAPKEATRCLAEANEGWEPRDAFERAGRDLAAAGVQLDLGQLEAAERSAASGVRSCSEGPYRWGRTGGELLLAEVHVRAGEPQGLTLAHHAIEAVSTLRSTSVRQERLLPLATALEARPGTDNRDLARKARQVATTRT